MDELQKERDALLLAAANGLHAWSGVEDGLYNLFLQVVEDPKAAIIWDAIVSFDARLKVINQIMLSQLRGQLDLPVWVKLVARIAKFYKKRHRTSAL